MNGTGPRGNTTIGNMAIFNPAEGDLMVFNSEGKWENMAVSTAVPSSGISELADWYQLYTDTGAAGANVAANNLWGTYSNTVPSQVDASTGSYRAGTGTYRITANTVGPFVWPNPMVGTGGSLSVTWARWSGFGPVALTNIARSYFPTDKGEDCAGASVSVEMTVTQPSNPSGYNKFAVRWENNDAAIGSMAFHVTMYKLPEES
jgi:hypothetical protein